MELRLTPTRPARRHRARMQPHGRAANRSFSVVTGRPSAWRSPASGRGDHGPRASRLDPRADLRPGHLGPSVRAASGRRSPDLPAGLRGRRGSGRGRRAVVRGRPAPYGMAQRQARRGSMSRARAPPARGRSRPRNVTAQRDIVAAEQDSSAETPSPSRPRASARRRGVALARHRLALTLVARPSGSVAALSSTRAPPRWYSPRRSWWCCRRRPCSRPRERSRRASSPCAVGESRSSTSRASGSRSDQRSARWATRSIRDAHLPRADPGAQSDHSLKAGICSRIDIEPRATHDVCWCRGRGPLRGGRRPRLVVRTAAGIRAGEVASSPRRGRGDLGTGGGHAVIVGTAGASRPGMGVRSVAGGARV